MIDPVDQIYALGVNLIDEASQIECGPKVYRDGLAAVIELLEVEIQASKDSSGDSDE